MSQLAIKSIQSNLSKINANLEPLIYVHIMYCVGHAILHAYLIISMISCSLSQFGQIFIDPVTYNFKQKRS